MREMNNFFVLPKTRVPSLPTANR